VTATIFEIPPTFPTRDDILNDPIQRTAADHAFYASQSGPWTVMPCSVAYTPLSQILTAKECAELHKDAQRIAEETDHASAALLTTQFKSGEKRGQIESLFDLGNWSPYFVSEPGKKYATMLQMLQYPFSRGSIHLPSKDDKPKTTVDDKPVIDPQYYIGAGELDKKIMAKAQRWADRICQTEPLAQIVRDRVFPPPAEGSHTEESVYDDFVSNYTITDWHRMFPFRSEFRILLLNSRQPLVPALWADMRELRLELSTTDFGYMVFGTCGLSMPASCHCRSERTSKQLCMQ
jgi:hypothetical protein